MSGFFIGLSACLVIYVILLAFAARGMTRPPRPPYMNWPRSEDEAPVLPSPKPVNLGSFGLWRVNDGEIHTFAAHSEGDALSQYAMMMDGEDMETIPEVKQIPFDEPYTLHCDDGIVVTLYPAQWYAITERIKGVALVGSTLV